MWKQAANAIPWLLVGTAAGLKFADIDQSLPFLTHRSILTHSCLLALILFWGAQKQSGQRRTAGRLTAIGFSLANAVHLSFDLFPKAWWRHALIHIPGYGWTSPMFSWVWLLASVFLCLWLALQRMHSKRELLLGLGCLVAAYSVAALTEPPIAGRALFMLLILGLGAFALPRRQQSS
ncbi:MAG TPA: hypothetical protein VFB21_22895 [Chthonomonadaceae bacterium]|nr:hypothetical protein [Chthonomonadaceae bacterium]